MKTTRPVSEKPKPTELLPHIPDVGNRENLPPHRVVVERMGLGNGDYARLRLYIQDFPVGQITVIKSYLLKTLGHYKHIGIPVFKDAYSLKDELQSCMDMMNYWQKQNKGTIGTNKQIENPKNERKPVPKQKQKQKKMGFI